MSEAETGAGSGRSGVRSQDSPERPGATRASWDEQGRASTRQLVLIAEDEEPIAEALSMVVDDAGYASVIATQGQQALDLARARRPDLVITDLMMPYLDGQELITALRADAARDGHRPPPIILMTAAGPRRAAAAGADVVLRKPFNIADVESLLVRFLGPAPPRRPPGEAGSDNSSR